MINKEFIASRIKDHESNIVTKMWNIQSKLENVIAMGRGDTDLDTPTTSSGSGDFSFNSLIASATQTYELIISKDEYEGDADDYFDGLSAVDASRIARHAGNYIDLTPNERLAANVNFDYRCEANAPNDYGDGAPVYTCLDGQQCLGLQCVDSCDATATTKTDCEQSSGISWLPNITGYDAYNVAMYAAGINDDLDDQCDPHWIFINPDNFLK